MISARSGASSVKASEDVGLVGEVVVLDVMSVEFGYELRDESVEDSLHMSVAWEDSEQALKDCFGYVALDSMR